MDSYIPYEDLDFMLYAGLGVVSIFAVIWLCMFVFIKLTGDKNEAVDAKQPPHTAPKASNLERLSGKGQGYISQSENIDSQSKIIPNSKKMDYDPYQFNEMFVSMDLFDNQESRNKVQIKYLRTKYFVIWAISILVGSSNPIMLFFLFLLIMIHASSNKYEKDKKYRDEVLFKGYNKKHSDIYNDLPIKIWR